MTPMQGIETLFKGSGEKGIKTAVISGTIKNAYDIFVDTTGLRPDFEKIAHEFHFDKQGILNGGSFTNFDFQGKVDALKEVCNEIGINFQDCAFVGNDTNDIPIFQKVALPIAFNSSKPQVKTAAKIVINGRDISKVLRYL